MVGIEVKGDSVMIGVRGLHKLLALKSQITIKGKNIRSAKLRDRSLQPPLWRIPGTYIPWIISAGTYYGRKRKEFWDVTSWGTSVELELENEKYTKVIVDVENPGETIRKIQDIA